MATTSKLRTSYPELVPDPVTPRCNYSRAVPVVFPAAGAKYPSGRVTLRVHPATRQLWRALAAVMLWFNYAFVETAGGTLSCRFIGGTSVTSTHAHGLAGDWNPSKNRFRRIGGLIIWGRQTDMPRVMVRAIEAIAMTNGLRCFEWGGRWFNIKDPMHFEVDQLQSRLAPVNLATLPAGAWAKYLAFERGARMTEDQMLDKNSPRPSKSVADFQAALIVLGFDLGTFTPFGPGYPPGADGYWGGVAAGATGDFQDVQDLSRTETGDALTVALALDEARAMTAAAPGGDHPDGDHSSLATKSAVEVMTAAVRSELASRLATHAKARASTSTHPHGHDEGQTGPPK